MFPSELGSVFFKHFAYLQSSVASNLESVASTIKHQRQVHCSLAVRWMIWRPMGHMNVAEFFLTRCGPKSGFGFCDPVDGSCKIKG